MKAKTLFQFIPLFVAIGTTLLSVNSSFGQSTDSLEQRLAKREIKAIKEAGESGMANLIPLLEEIYNQSASQYDATRPWSQKALAKLGVKKYRDEILEQLINPTNTSLYEAHLVRSTHGDSDAAIWLTQADAFRALAYVNDKSTVAVIASFLSETNQPPRSIDVIRESSAAMASWTLARMDVIAPPEKPFLMQRVNLWQNWWELHKDYYEKLEFGQPPPPPPGKLKLNTSGKTTNSVPVKTSTAASSTTTAAAVAEQKQNPGHYWIMVTLIALGALLCGVILWRAKHREH
jgi:hypothetical protein